MLNQYRVSLGDVLGRWADVCFKVPVLARVCIVGMR
jgi:hypothetical protein